MKIRKDLVDYIYFGFFGILILLFLTGQFSSLTGTTLVVIDNPDPNSMFPTYFQGDLFLIYKDQPEDIALGDVIVYSLSEGGNRIIHRVIDIEYALGETYFRVKGDNPVTNYSPDIANGGTLVSFEQVVGKVVARIPYLGHFSLAMQRSFLVQFIIYVSAIGIALYVIFSPNDEEEDEDKFYNFERESFLYWKTHQTERVRYMMDFTLKSPFRWVGRGLIIMIVLMLLVPLFIPAFLPLNSSGAIGVTQIEVNRDIAIKETLPVENTQFYNLSVHIFDDSSSVQHIDGYILNVKNGNGEIIDTTIWNTRRIMKGQFVVGGSITIDDSIFRTFPTGTQLTIEVILTVKTLFSSYELDPFTQIFTTEANPSFNN